MNRQAWPPERADQFGPGVCSLLIHIHLVLPVVRLILLGLVRAVGLSSCILRSLWNMSNSRGWTRVLLLRLAG